MADSNCGPDERVRRPGPGAIVLFGATGDLTRRKLIPALYSLFLQNLLPDKVAIVAFARRDKDNTVFREDLRQAVSKFAPAMPSSGSQWDAFANIIHYHRSDLDDIAGYNSLRERLTELDDRLVLEGNRLFYLATPPDNFAKIAKRLGESGLVHK